MLLEDDAAELELHVAGYQFPGLTVGPDGDGWDANWLVIAGSVRTAAEGEWTFCDPGLTTWEAEQVVGWLEAAARGALVPVRATGGDDGDGTWWWDVLHARGWKVFTEPCLALGIAGPGRPAGGDRRDERLVHVLVGLGAEWGPPPPPEEAHAWCCLELLLTPGQLMQAASDLRRELAVHPRR